MPRPEILMMRSLIERTQQELEATYEVHRYDTAQDRDALVQAIAPRVTAIATRGDYPLPGALMQRLPNVKIIAASGLSVNEAAAESANSGAHSFLLKPYTAKNLLEKLAAVLGQ